MLIHTLLKAIVVLKTRSARMRAINQQSRRRSLRRSLRQIEGLEKRELLAGVYDSAVLADSPVAYYRLGDTPPVPPISDASGHGLSGTLLNTISLGQTGALPIVSNTSARLSTNGDGVLIADNIQLTPGTTVTFEAWIKPDAASAGHFQNLISKRDYLTGLGFEYEFGISSSGFLTFNRSLDGTNIAGTVTSSSPVPSGQWEHVAMTLNGSSVAFYINGSVAGGGSISAGTFLNTSAPVQIGTARNANFQFLGSIQEVATFANSLNLFQIQSHYQSAAAGTYSATVLSSFPVAYWRLGDNPPISDTSGNALSGTLLNGISLGQTGVLAGDTNTAARFSSTGDGVLISDSNLQTLGTTATFETWIKPDAAGNGQFQNLLSKYDYTVSNFGTEYEFLIAPDGKLYFGRGNLGSVVSSVAVSSGVWQHVAATFNNGSVSFYINGILVGAGAISGSAFSNTSAPVQIGTARNTPYQFRGLMDEVAIYPSALSATRILAHYKAGSNLAPTNISYASASVPANLPFATVVGRFSSTDPNSGDTFTYSLVTGSGGTDNLQFQIVGNQLATASLIHFSDRSSYSVRVRSTDQDGLSIERVFTIVLVDNVFPSVVSINRTTPAGLITNANNVVFTTTFSKAVTGVDSTDFSLIKTGTIASSLIQVVDSGDHLNYTVTVSGITGDGTLGLNLTDNNSIRDLSGNALVPPNAGVSYASQVTYATGSSTAPYSVISADVNGDGKPDLITTNNGAGTVSILLGGAGGTFGTPTQFSTGTSPRSVAAGDINGDGKLDLVVANLSGPVVVLLGTGTGSFGASQTVATGSLTNGVALGDLDGDGKLDIVIANRGNGTAGVLLNRTALNASTVSFAAQASPVAGLNPRSITLGYLDGDATMDMVVPNSGSNNVSVMLGTGTGTFGAATNISTGSVARPYSAVIADVNGDGKLDLVTGNTGISSVGLMLGNGNGTFQSQVLLPVGTGDSDAVAVQDVNGDGRPDVIAIDYINNTVNVLLQNINGTFQAPQALATGTHPGFVTMTDVNLDGRPEIVVSNFGGDTVSVYRNSLNGDFTGQAFTMDHTSPSVQSISRTTPASSTTNANILTFTATFSEAVTGVDATDFSVTTTGSIASTSTQVVDSGDHKTFAVTVGGVTGDGTLGLNLVDNNSIRDLVGNLLRQSNSVASFATQVNVASGNQPRNVMPGDFNGDGKSDLIATNINNNTLSLMLGNGDGTFQTPQTVAAATGPIWLTPGDVNGDGKLDVVVAEYSNNRVGVLLGNGDGTFQSQQTFPVGTAPRSVSIADLNGDGKLDLVVTNGGTNTVNGFTVSILLGNGNGTFQTQTAATTGAFPISVVISDLNGDGIPDLAVANLKGNSVSVLLGIGNGTFQAQSTLATGSSPIFVTTGDLNGDGKLDIVAANSNSASLSVMLGNGNGTFQAQQVLTVGSNPTSAIVGDVNGDGYQDIIATNQIGNTASVILGSAGGTFQPQQTFATGTGPSSIAMADLNGDGRPDIATSNYGSNNLRVLLNTVNGNFTGQTYTIDHTAPFVISTSFLQTGTVSVGTSSLTVTFNEAVTGANVTSNYQLQAAGADGLLGTADDSTISITSANLNGNTATLNFVVLSESVYRLTVNSGMTDVVGNASLSSFRDFVCVNPKGRNDSLPNSNAGTHINATAAQSDGRIIMAGTTSTTSFGSLITSTLAWDFILQRMNNDGTIDSSFNVTTSFNSGADVARAVAVQSDGKIVAAGYTYNGTNKDFAIARYNSNGTLDTTFNGVGKLQVQFGSSDDEIAAVAIQSDGKIIVAGYTNNGSNKDFAIARFTSTGSLDTTFNSTGKVSLGFGSSDDEIEAIALQSDGKILVTGYSNNGTNKDFAVARYSTNGALDTTFNTTGKFSLSIGSGDDIANSLAIQTDGKILVAGSTASGSDSDLAIARMSSSGTLDSTFGTAGKRSFGFQTSSAEGVRQMALQSDGKILLVSNSNTVSNVDSQDGVRLNTDGSFDATFGVSGRANFGMFDPSLILTANLSSANSTAGATLGQANTLNLRSDGSIVVAGYLQTYFNADGVSSNGREKFGEGVSIVRLDSRGAIAPLTLISPSGFGFDLGTSSVGTGQILQGPTNSFDGLNRIQINGTDATFAATPFPQLSNSGQTYATGNASAAGLTINRQVTVPNTGSEDFARTVDTFTNSTASAITTTVKIVGNLGSDAVTTVFATSSGGTTPTVNDTWFGTDSGVGTQAVIHLLHGSRGLVPTNVQVVGDNVTWAYSLTVNPGQTKELGEFTIVANTRAAAIAAVNALVNANGFTGQAAAFLTSTDLTSFANFQFNQPPTDLALSANTVAENQPAGTTVGTLTTTDPDAGNTFTYSLVTGIGSTDNSSFTIDASGNLKTTASFDYETKNSYSIRVRSTDQDGLFFEKVLTINVMDVNEAPTNIVLSQSAIPENKPIGTTVGQFSSTDPDSGNTFTYTLVGGPGSTDNSSFTIDGSGNLKTAASFDYETKNSYSIRVRSTDQGALFVEKSFTINITDVDEIPPAVVLTNFLTTGTVLSGTTQLTVAFSEPVLNATVAANYELRGAGADRLLLNSDSSVTPTSVTLNGNTATLTFPNLVEDVYRLTVFPSITDTAGNTLDGDGNGIPGDEWRRDFVANSDGRIVLDPSFDNDGKLTTSNGPGDDVATGVAVQSDGKVVVVGSSFNGTNYDFLVTRYNANGSLDTSFDGDGKLIAAFGTGDDFATGIAIQSDGKIVVVGYSSNGSDNDFAVARYNLDGSLDTTFDGDGKLTTAIGASYDEAYTVAIQNDGKIVVAGRSINGGWFDFAVTRYNTNGSLDTTFDGDGKLTTAIGTTSDVALSVAIQSDGRIVAAGLSSNASVTDFDFAVARYNANGSLDTTFDSDGKLTTAIGPANDAAYGVAIQSDGKIVAVGYSFNGNNYDFAVTRYNTNGSLDTTFDGDGKLTTAVGTLHDYANGVAIQGDGKIVVAGSSHNGLNDDFAVTRYNADGSLDTAFDDDGKLTISIGTTNDEANAVAIQSDGKIVVVGQSYNGTNQDFAVVRLGTTSSTLPLRSPNNSLFDIDAQRVGTGQLLQGPSNAFDGVNRLIVSSSDYSPTGTSTTSNAGQTVVTPNANYAGLTVHREITVPTTGIQDFARTVDVLTNSTGSPITTTIKVVGNLGSDAATNVFATSTGGTTPTVNDTWFGTDGGVGTSAVIHLLHGPMGLVPSNVQLIEDNVAWTYNVTVKPGETKELGEYIIVANTRAAAIAAVNALFNANGFTGQAAAFLTSTDLASLANFQFNQAPTNLAISSGNVAENQPAGTTAGVFTTSDPDVGNTFTYSLASGTGSTDNASFTIDAVGNLKTVISFDYETKKIYSIRVRSTDQDGLFFEKVFAIAITDINEPVVLTLANASVSGNVLTQITNSGTWNDPESAQVILSASFGVVTKNANGTWSWAYTPNVALLNQVVTISANDGTNVSSTTFNVTAFTTIATRGIQYAGATGASASTSLATDKVPLLPSQSSTFANYTNYSRGLNCLVIDVVGLPATVTNAQLAASLQFANWDGIAAAEFVALPGAAVPTVAIVAGGVAGSTRVQTTFPDNTLQNTWLRVTVVANSDTGLAANDVFYFGNVLGDINVDNTTTRIRVNELDTSAVRNNQSTGTNSVGVTNIYDVNRDGRVNALDTSFVRNNQQSSGIVAPITAPSSFGRSGGGGLGGQGGASQEGTIQSESSQGVASQGAASEGAAASGNSQMPSVVPSSQSFAGGAVNLIPAIGSRLTGESYDVPRAGLVGNVLPEATSEPSIVENAILPEVTLKKKRSETETAVSQLDNFFACLAVELEGSIIS